MINEEGKKTLNMGKIRYLSNINITISLVKFLHHKNENFRKIIIKLELITNLVPLSLGMTVRTPKEPIIILEKESSNEDSRKYEE